MYKYKCSTSAVQYCTSTYKCIEIEIILSFYSIALKLKSLFLLFAGHLVGAFAKMLDLCNTYKKQTGQPL